MQSVKSIPVLKRRDAEQSAAREAESLTGNVGLPPAVWLRSALQRVLCQTIEFEQRTKPGSVSDTFVEPLNERIESVVETQTQNPEPAWRRTDGGVGRWTNRAFVQKRVSALGRGIAQ